MSTIIYLIRHGEVDYPLDAQGTKLIYGADIPLAPLGRLQIQKLGERLKKERRIPDILAVSPYKRARESADILKKVFGVSLTAYTVDDLKDVYPNSWEGYPLNDLRQYDGDIYSHSHSANQETLEHLSARARRAMEIIVRDNPGQKIGIISHGDLLSAVDWMLKHSDTPISYKEMKDNFYLNKGQACEYIVDDALRIKGEGQFITMPEVNQSIEGFRRVSSETQ